jgi:hypothetical protein
MFCIPFFLSSVLAQNLLVFVDTLSVVQFDFFDLTGMSCGLDINHANKLVVAALLPIFLLTTAALSSAIAKSNLKSKLLAADNKNTLLPLWVDALSSAFDLIDVDASHELDIEELKQLLNVTNTSSTKNVNAAHILEEWDRDKSGTLSREEFLHEMQTDRRFGDPVKCHESHVELILFARGKAYKYFFS